MENFETITLTKRECQVLINQICNSPKFNEKEFEIWAMKKRTFEECVKHILNMIDPSNK